MESYLRGAEIAFSWALSHARKHGKTSQFSNDLYPLLVQGRRNLGLFQHHDGITGTAKDFVVVDYGNRLLKAIKDCQKV